VREIDVTTVKREIVVRVVGCMVPDVGFFYTRAYVLFVKNIRLCNKSEVKERVDTYIEMLFEQVKINYTEAELNIGISIAIGENTVAQDTPQRVASAQTFVEDTMDKESVEVGIEVIGAASDEDVLCADTVGEDDTVGVNGYIVAEGEIEAQMVESGGCLLSEHYGVEGGRIGKESICIDTVCGTRLLVA